MNTLIALFLSSALYVTEGSEVCRQCGIATQGCGSSRDCPNGFVNSTGGCCQVCLRDEGEICGGPFKICGICKTNLICRQQQQGYYGVCQKFGAENREDADGKAAKRIKRDGIFCFDFLTSRKRIPGERWIIKCKVATCDGSGKIHITKLNCTNARCGSSIGKRCCSKCQIKVENVVCTRKNIVATLKKQDFMTLSASQFSFKDKNCGASENQTHIILQTALTNCGTVRRVTKNNIEFQNRILVWQGNTVFRLFKIVTCSFKRFLASPSRGFKVALVGKDMVMYYTTKTGRILPSKKLLEVDEGDSVYVVVMDVNKNRNKRKGVVLEKCSIRPSNETVKYKNAEHILIKDGCRVDKSLQVLRIWSRGVWFLLKAEMFFGQEGNPMVLQCHAHSCSDKLSNRLQTLCQQNCLSNYISPK